MSSNKIFLISVLIVADWFYNLPKNKKLELAKKYFDATWIYAQSGGYSKKKLQKWFENTALIADTYTTKSISLKEGFGRN